MLKSISELANLTGQDRRRIGRCLVDLQPEKGPKGSLLYDSVQALPLLYLTPGDGDSYDLTQQRARLTFHLANKAQLEAEKLKGALIAVEDVADVVGAEYSNVRAKLLSIPTRAAPQVVGLSTVAIRSALDDLIRECLEELTADGPLSITSTTEH